MTTYLDIDDEFKRTLGFLPNDEMIDPQVLQRMITALRAAEFYVQGAIGDANASFYKRDDIFPLYRTACVAIAANWFNHPATAVSSTTAKSIIGQLRGSYDESEVSDDGSITKSGQTNSDD